jgi:hypothetical protein
MELDSIERIDLETDDPQHPPELLDFLGTLVERCERDLGRRLAPPPFALPSSPPP